MSDRLTELQRQRALAQEQVAWFDREIARESGAVGKPAEPVVAPITTAPLMREVSLARDATTPVSDTDLLLKQYRGSGKSIHSEVKRGCLIYFFAAFALLTLSVAAFAFFWSR